MFPGSLPLLGYLRCQMLGCCGVKGRERGRGGGRKASPGSFALPAAMILFTGAQVAVALP